MRVEEAWKGAPAAGSVSEPDLRDHVTLWALRLVGCY